MLLVSPPLLGVYISPNTPGSKVPSHGTSCFGEEYAIDFVMIPESGKSKKPYRKSFFSYVCKGLPLDDFYGWGQRVYSPVNGRVIEVENTIRERNPVNIFKDYKNTITVTHEFMKNYASSKMITGNYVMIEMAKDAYALLVHLKQGSVCVQVGQEITTHDVLGELGHSGNSTMPHLHMQFMDSRDFSIAKGLPFIFDTYKIKNTTNWVTIRNAVPKVEDIIKFEME
ncbi:metalloendopeptidase-like membrane protein [Sphaerochaeta pleomorpha str. Grapes]|uniref:Metalloendopeptidase-like membrane protein n=2 Tax=Sphaerochaeta TaxID=399320 RepID=G8QSF0_SPHPG|nr:metalloendopeptidase-like membrane protein [Sphaerochaeta pleomorpha str. Grapes]